MASGCWLLGSKGPNRHDRDEAHKASRCKSHRSPAISKHPKQHSLHSQAKLRKSLTICQKVWQKRTSANIANECKPVKYNIHYQIITIPDLVVRKRKNILEPACHRVPRVLQRTGPYPAWAQCSGSHNR